MDILNLNIKTLRVLFLWPHKNLSKNMNRLGSILVLLNLTIFTSPVTAAVIYQFLYDCNFNIILEVIIAMADAISFAFLYSCFLWKYELIEKLIKNIDVFLQFCNEKVIREAEIKVRKYTKWTLLYFTAGLVFNATVPLLDIENCKQRRLSDYYILRDPCGLPTPNWYPFDVSGTVLLILVCVLEFQVCLFIAFGVLIITMSLIGLLIHIIAQLQNCRKMILEIFDEKDPEIIEKKANFCIEYHITIIEYAKSVNKAFNRMMLLHISITSFVISVLGYQIIMVNNVSDKIRYIMHLGGWIALLFITCLYGQALIDESTSTAEAAYNSKWYNGSIRVQKTIRLIIMRAQKPLTLNAAQLGVMSYETFVRVMKTAYSYFALILTITN